jgi:hypothetical protein
MSETFLSVETEGLQEAIDNATNIDWAVLTDALGEGITRFKDRLRGDNVRPGNPWPIGTRKLVNGVKAHYVPLGTENSERSGRSLRGWKARQRGISAVVFNDARDKIGGTFYAQHARRVGDKRGQDADGLGPAAQDALKIFEEEMEKVAEIMIASLTEQISGD